MEQSSPSLPPAAQPTDGAQRPMIQAMDVQPAVTEDDPSYSSALWDWGDLLDFTVDDHLPISFDCDQPQANLPPPNSPPPPQTQLESAGSDRVRKRDPRLVCSNFLAGRIPCACPEMDELLAEEEATLPGKKRARTVRVRARTARCQVPGCGADISELKGYHRRHRVCLRCANASSVLLDGETKRYCQQCGKFHVLSDFDEGKRSCRRKLERHNNRRRRKPVDSNSLADKEPQGPLQNENGTCDGDVGKDTLCLSSQIADQEALLEFEDQRISTLKSASVSQNVNSDSVLSFVASGETQMDGGKDDGKCSLSPSYCENKSAYSSVCPAGRISFKLYDWNPAEFPRRLRHQIFQWLASMPVELEGYIRPGCTILTVFIAMSEKMWAKLFEDPVAYLHEFIVKPGKMLSGRGPMTVYLNNMIFHVIKGGTSVMEVNVKVHAPRLHYVHPTCFEAGKPIEFIACGSNLLQPKFRFLISFAGKYLAYDYRVASQRGQAETTSSFDHQLYKIYIRHTEPNLFGPAFIEVENESGLSNFIPVLIGDEEVCSEIKSMERNFDVSLFSKGQQFVAANSLPNSCEAFVLRQTAFSDIALDIAWLLKEPALESIQEALTSSQMQRFVCLLSFLIHNKSTSILGKVLKNLNILVDFMGLNNVADGTGESDVGLLQKHMSLARDILHKEHLNSEDAVLHPECASPKVKHGFHSCSRGDMLSIIPTMVKDLDTRTNFKLGVRVASTSVDRSETDPLLSREVVMNMNLMKEWPRESCRHFLSGGVLRSRPTLFLIATAAVCFGVCAVLFHPHKVGEFAISIRRCLFDKI